MLNKPNGTERAESYITFLMQGISLDRMSGSFLGSLTLFTLARFGGMAIPDSLAGKSFWAGKHVLNRSALTTHTHSAWSSVFCVAQSSCASSSSNGYLCFYPSP